MQEQFLKDWDERGNLTAEERKYIKTSITLALKVTDSIMNRIDGNLRQRLIRDMKATDLFCLPKSEAKLKKDRFEKEVLSNELIKVSRDAIDELAQRAMDWCNPCNVVKCDECILREIFRQLDLEPYDCEATECEYRIKKGGGEIE
jgi:hypothetical protein